MSDQDLPQFEGMPVVASAVRITRAGDGLSEALKLEPQELHHGQEVWFVLHGTISRVSHDPVPKADGILQRVHTVRADEVAMVGQEDVKDLLDRERERVLALKEQAAGITRLPMGGEDPLGVFDPAGDLDQ